MTRFFFFLIALAFSPVALHAQCQPWETKVRLEIDPDQYYTEVSWKLIDLNSGFVFAEGQPANDGPQVFEYCITQGICVVFSMEDSYGDGMFPDGNYKLFLDDTLYHEYTGYDYGYGENVTFGCPPGGFCTNPLPIDTGSHTTINGFEIWYSFTPQDTGTYRISTCDAQLNCPTKIWVYDECQGIVLSDDNTGATFYSDGGCDTNPNGAEAELYLAGGKEYYIRMGYADGICNGAPIDFTLDYMGPVVGCNDPQACNYQPLATVSDTCIYPGDPDCTDLPDLIVLEDVLRNTLVPDFLPNDDPCYVDEGCINGFGTRYILRFTTHIQNIGVADYFIGEPPADPDSLSNQFIWDPCHNHWHYRGYADYLLYDENGVRLPIGSKNGFCVLDLECAGGGSPKYSCSNMGISAGCGDIYDASLPCQWIDLTDLPAGFYTMVVRVNWQKAPDETGRVEMTYDNNWAQACFELKYNGDGSPYVEEVNDCPIYTDCFGETFGPAQPDCSGECGGALLHGDWDLDTLQQLNDIEQYLAHSLNATGDATTCFDLDEDGNLDVYDAALLQECVIHADEVQYWGTRYACVYPGGIDNPDDIVYLQAGALDTVNKTFDVHIINPFSKLYGFEFSVSGLNIASIENLDTTFNGIWEFNAQNKIQALTTTENGLKKNILPGGLIRIHYSELTGTEVCIEDIFNIVNEKYHRSTSLIADPSCIPVITTSTNTQQSDQQLLIMPNPAKNYFTVFFGWENPGKVELSLRNASGQLVYQSEEVAQQSVRIGRGVLEPGLYFLTVSTERGVFQERVVFE